MEAEEFRRGEDTKQKNLYVNIGGGLLEVARTLEVEGGGGDSWRCWGGSEDEDKQNSACTRCAGALAAHCAQVSEPTCGCCAGITTTTGIKKLCLC